MRSMPPSPKGLGYYRVSLRDTKSPTLSVLSMRGGWLMTTVESVHPRLSATATPGLRHFIVLWLIVAALEGLLLAQGAKLDSLLWRTTRWVMGDQDEYAWAKVRQAPDSGASFYRTTAPPLHSTLYKKTENLWRILRDMGEPHCTVILLVVVALYDRRRLKASALLLASAAGASGVGELIRCVSGRLRPDGMLPAGVRNDGGSMFHFLGGFQYHHDLSFPSGHATLAFATAATLCYLSPRGRGLFLTLAAGCAVTRVVMQAHFYSDVLLGSAIGWTFGCLITVLMDRLLPGENPAPQRPRPEV